MNCSTFGARNMFDEESKAIQEVAKASGKLLEVASALGNYFSRFSDGPFSQSARYIAEQIQFARYESQLSFLEKIQTRIAANPQIKAHRRNVPLKVLVPLIEAATLEENDDLQEKWAALLLNAADSTFSIEIQRSYLSMLAELSVMDAKILEAVYALPFADIQHNGVSTAELPNRATVFDPRIEYSTPKEEVLISIGNLTRIGCLRVGLTWGGGESSKIVSPTILGKNFVLACSTS